MSAAVFPVVEYDAEWGWQEFRKSDDEPLFGWTRRIAVDLTKVIEARPSENEDKSFSVTQIIVPGVIGWQIINAPYDDFMRDWMRARG